MMGRGGVSGGRASRPRGRGVRVSNIHDNLLLGKELTRELKRNRVHDVNYERTKPATLPTASIGEDD